MFEQKFSLIVDGAGDFYSHELLLNRNAIAFMEAEWPAGIIGTIEAQISGRGSIWQSVDGSQIELDGTAGGQIWNYEKCGAPRARLHINVTSGTGQIIVCTEAKGGPS